MNTEAFERGAVPPRRSSAPRTSVPEPLHGLLKLARDLRWSWDFSADALWSKLDPELWTLTRNPWLLLQATHETRLNELAEDPDFARLLAEELDTQRRALTGPKWFDELAASGSLSCVAYFAMEFGLSEALPLYSGGLGILAGDHLKAASDLGVPLIGVGLLYQRGYFRQVLGSDGTQHEIYPYNDPSQLPIAPARTAEGDWLRLPIALPGRALWLRAWEARVGAVPLYLLDSNDAVNFPADRGITGELYGGGPELRIQQELVLGFGGFALLRALGFDAQVCHLNEGHGAFAVLARAEAFAVDTGLPWGAALVATRPGNVFTTHTPVPAGFDRFDSALVARYLAPLAARIGVPLESLLGLGRHDPADGAEPFNMAYLAVRGSGAINGVSRLHGEVSRALFQDLFPRWPRGEVPVDHVTNGVHVPSWESAQTDDLLRDPCGPQRWLGAMDEVGSDVRGLDAECLWSCRSRQRHMLVEFARLRLAQQRAGAGEAPERVAEADRMLDPNALTLGLARRFASYKRPNLLLREPDRLARLLADPRRPVQLIVAGKAHPRDEEGKALIQAWSAFAERGDVRGRAVFLADYDMLLAERLVQGVDLWINTPRRPWEASGTSGMKVLVNGGLNLSELDGWWAEAFAPEVGWALGDSREHGDDPAWDTAEAEALYRTLEAEVVPCFYDRDASGIPTRWVARIRESLARLAPRFSSNRMVREYTERFYVPAAAAYRRRAAEHGKLAAELDHWLTHVHACFGQVRIGRVDVERKAGGSRFEAHVYLGELAPEDVCVELYAEPQPAAESPVRLAMERCAPLSGALHGFCYAVEAPVDRPADHYTVRVSCSHPEIRRPLECASILWQR